MPYQPLTSITYAKGIHAQFLGAGPGATKVALYFDQNLISAAQAKRLFKSDSETIVALQEAGFVHDAGGGILFIPFTFNRETLAKAFEDDDFTAAFAPLAEALEKATAALPLLDRLVTAVRQAAG